MLKHLGKIVLGIIVIIILAAAILLGVFTTRYLEFQKQKKMPFAEQNVIIYDKFCDNIRKKYYDPNFGGNDWNKICLDGRQKAKLAKTNVELAMIMAKDFEILKSSHQSLTLKKRINPLYAEQLSSNSTQPNVLSKLKEKYKDAIDISGIEYSSINIRGKPRTVITWVYPNTPAFEAAVKPNYPLYVKDATIEVDAKGNKVFYDYGYILQTEYYDDRVINSPGDNRQKIPDINYVQPIMIKFQTNIPRVAKYSNLIQIPPSVSYIKLQSFDKIENINQVFEIAKTSPNGIILDLRENRGGSIKYENKLISLFLPPDTICGYRVSRNKTNKFSTNGIFQHYEGQLIILINSNSASASEVFSSCIMHYKRGVVIGENSNGSVLASRFYRLGFWGKQHIPIENYLDANKNPIEGIGVTPDIIVHPTLEGIKQGRDEILERAVQEISKTH